jgi:guanylate kinase
LAGPPLLVVLTGPSGAGKDSVLAELKSLPDRPYSFVVTVTTRPPRPTERDGVDYDFVSKAQFQQLLDQGELLEHAVVYDQEKGVPKAAVRKILDSGRDALMRTDVQGARFIKKLAPAAVTIFIAPPSEDELIRRMRARGGDSDEQVAIRIQTAREEMAAAPEFDYVVTNDDLAETAEQIETIIVEERGRPERKAVHIA